MTERTLPVVRLCWKFVGDDITTIGWLLSKTPDMVTVASEWDGHDKTYNWDSIREIPLKDVVSITDIVTHEEL